MNYYFNKECGKGLISMAILQNAETIVSLICGILSLIMFLLAKQQKDKCISISNKIEQQIQLFSKESSINSNDEFNIKQVKTFDNRKSIN